jgi:hypothetical protein
LERLERGRPGTWRDFAAVPLEQWPDHALLSLVAESQAWPPGCVPSDDDLRAVAARGGGGKA